MRSVLRATIRQEVDPCQGRSTSELGPGDESCVDQPAWLPIARGSRSSVPLLLFRSPEWPKLRPHSCPEFSMAFSSRQYHFGGSVPAEWGSRPGNPRHVSHQSLAARCRFWKRSETLAWRLSSADTSGPIAKDRHRHFGDEFWCRQEQSRTLRRQQEASARTLPSFACAEPQGVAGLLASKMWLRLVAPKPRPGTSRTMASR